MKVLAIGATGFVGLHVVRLLAGDGHDVCVLHRARRTTGLPEGAREVRGDRDSLTDCRSELESLGPDVVLDMIPYTEQHARGVVQLFRGKAERVVAVSSADVYRNYDGWRGRTSAPPDPVPLSERAPLRETRYPYRGQGFSFRYANDYEKILVEHVVLSEPALPATVLRFPAVYGPGDMQHRLRSYLRRMSPDSAEIALDERQAGWRWTRGFVDNVAAAVTRAVASPESAGRVYNVGDEPTLTEHDWVRGIAAAAGWEGNVVTAPPREFSGQTEQPPNWRYDLWTDTSAIRLELGYVQPVELDEALRRTLAWERSQARGG